MAMIGQSHPMYRHGHRTGGRSKEWRAWHAMKARCKYPCVERFPRYGGRGIKVCVAWEIFENFLADVGMAPGAQFSLDRIDNKGDYEPGNVRWATRSQQIRNSTKARHLTHDGRTQTIGDWAAATGINRQTIQMRIDRYGMTVSEALTTPPGGRIDR